MKANIVQLSDDQKAFLLSSLRILRETYVEFAKIDDKDIGAQRSCIVNANKLDMLLEIVQVGAPDIEKMVEEIHYLKNKVMALQLEKSKA